jgi:putative FmdB family regulatory protein
VPTYQYRCTECGGEIEAVQKFSDDPLTKHDACGGRLRKVFSPVGIVFKGSGFYRTDSRKDSPAPAPAASSPDSASGDKKSGDKKSGEKTSADSSASSSDSGKASSGSSGSSSSSSTPAGSSSGGKRPSEKVA